MTAYTMPSGRYERGGDYVTVPAGTHGWRIVNVAVFAALLTSIGWYWLLLDERAEHRQQIVAEQAVSERLLADAVARMTPIRSLTIQYRNGAKATVNMKEVTP